MVPFSLADERSQLWWITANPWQISSRRKAGLYLTVTILVTGPLFV